MPVYTCYLEIWRQITERKHITPKTATGVASAGHKPKRIESRDSNGYTYACSEQHHSQQPNGSNLCLSWKSG